MIAFRYLVLISLAALTTLPAFAMPSTTGQKSLGTFGAWQAFSYTDNDQPVCYMVKAAHIPVPKNKKFKRGATYLMITHRPGENSRDVVSYTSGYNFRAASDVTIQIGKDKYGLFTQRDSAWSRDTKTDHALASSIRMNTLMKITGLPSPQNLSPITDTLDIRGATSAYQAIGRACGLETETAPNPRKTTKKRPPPPKKKL